MPKFEAVLYTRRGCCLCDTAKLKLESHGLVVREIDIDAEANRQHREKYDQCVPVVWINGKERFRGRVDEFLLRRILRSKGG